MGDLDPAQIQRSLRQNFLFATLDDAEIADLAGQVRVESTPSDALIVRENDKADGLFMVIKGGVNVVKANGQFLAFLGPGGFFGEMALFIEGSARTANCVAVGDVDPELGSMARQGHGLHVVGADPAGLEALFARVTRELTTIQAVAAIVPNPPGDYSLALRVRSHSGAIGGVSFRLHAGDATAKLAVAK
jgi:hypothetical protein